MLKKVRFHAWIIPFWPTEISRCFGVLCRANRRSQHGKSSFLTPRNWYKVPIAPCKIWNKTIELDFEKRATLHKTLELKTREFTEKVCRCLNSVMDVVWSSTQNSSQAKKVRRRGDFLLMVVCTHRSLCSAREKEWRPLQWWGRLGPWCPSEMRRKIFLSSHQPLMYGPVFTTSGSVTRITVKYSHSWYNIHGFTSCRVMDVESGV